MRNIKNKIVFAFILPLILTGCDALTGQGYKYSEDARINHPIRVTPSERTLNLWSDGRGHAVGDINEVRNFAMEYVRKGHGPVILEGTREDVKKSAEILIANGVSATELRVVSNPGFRDHVNMMFRLYEAKADSCGQFKTDNYNLFSNFWNNSNSEFGCSAQNNLSAMISDPLDLVHRRSSLEPSQAPIVGRSMDYQTYVQPPVPEKQSSSK